MSSVLLDSADRAAASPDRVYIVGAGVAGLLTAWAIGQDCQRSGRALPALVMIDRAVEPGAGLTAGNGRSLTASEGLVAGGLTPDQLAVAFQTPIDQGGYAYPGFQATAADRTAIEAFLDRARAAAPQAAAQEQAMLRFGLQNLELWRDFAHQCPQIAARTGLHLGPKLRIYQGPTAEAKAHREVDRLNQASGPEAVAGVVSVAEAIALNPGLEGFLTRDPFAGCITRQPGGAIHASRLVAELAAQLESIGCLQWQLATQIVGIERDASGRIQHLRAITGGQAITLGNAGDQFIFATGFDPLLAQSGAVAAALFPIAGTSITFRVPPAAIAQSLRFPRRAWKHDGFAGPLVISPTLIPSADFLGWLDALADRGVGAIDPRELTGDRAGFIDPHWCATETAIDPARLDPRQLDRFQPDALGPTAGQWEIRIGGCKFYPGADRPLDLDHPGAQWALRSQLIAAQQFFPELLALNLGGPIDPSEIDLGTIGPLQPWVGPRPVYADGQAIVQPCAPNGFAISGTGSWGLASGPGNGAIAAHWLATRATPMAHPS